MHRRRFLAAIGGCSGLLSMSGCAGFLPTGGGDAEPDYPGGTVVIENAGDDTLDASVSVEEEELSSSLETTVSAGETSVHREFVAASEGESVTLAARIGGEGEPTTFAFLPAGGDDAPPEVARLTLENDVEASATWTATDGS